MYIQKIYTIEKDDIVTVHGNAAGQSTAWDNQNKQSSFELRIVWTKG